MISLGHVTMCISTSDRIVWMDIGSLFLDEYISCSWKRGYCEIFADALPWTWICNFILCAMPKACWNFGDYRCLTYSKRIAYYRYISEHSSARSGTPNFPYYISLLGTCKCLDWSPLTYKELFICPHEATQPLVFRALNKAEKASTSSEIEAELLSYRPVWWS